MTSRISAQTTVETTAPTSSTQEAAHPESGQEPVEQPPGELTTIEKLRGLPWSIASNATNTVFVQFTFFGSIFVLFLNALGLSKTEMGFVLSLIPFCGLIALFVAPAVERIGYKRAYLIFFGMRNFFAALLLLTPWVHAQYGTQTTLTFVAVIIGIFSLVRSVGVTASFPWVQEYVPNHLRGKYTAMNNIAATVVGFLAVSAGGYVLGITSGLTGFMLLIAIGVAFGLISVGLASLIPGGAPRRAAPGQPKQGRELGAALRDRSFMTYLVGVGLVTLITVPLGSFVPLFMQEEIGLNDSQIVMLQTGTLLGTLISSYLWGWAADRYGSIPIILYGLTLRAALPIVWMLMPREPGIFSLTLALSLAFLQGVADMGWGIGTGRLLYVNIVPPEKRTDYMALYYAWTGMVGGISQLSGGRILDFASGLSGQFWFFTIDPYLPLFVGGVLLPLISAVLLRTIREDKALTMGQFAGVFLRGNPFLAMSSMVRYHLARDEHSTVLVTERLSQSKSPLTVDELLETLKDPRFNVRFEAVISIARMPPDPRLTDALVEILHGTELALTVIAAWALGRIGDVNAIGPLRQGLDSDYRSVRAACARALGALGDLDVAPELLARLQRETDKGLQMAYASALGNLHYTAATETLLALLRDTQNEGARMELALTLARLIGDEHHFVQLVRSVRADPGTATAQALNSVKRRLERNLNENTDVLRLLVDCTESLARANLDKGGSLLSNLIRALPTEQFSPPSLLILEECAARLDEYHAQHLEYLLLALHTMHAGWK